MSLAAWLPTALVAALLLASPCSGLAPATRLSPRHHRPALRAITAAADADPARRPVVVPKDSPSQPPGASLATSTINLVKGVIGSSVFALPAGVAAFASTRAALVPSFLLLGAVATLSGYTFWMIARVNEATDTDSFGGAWRATFGESTSWVPSAIIVAKCFASCLTYTMVIGDSFAPILGAAAAPAWLASRSGAILSILPLVVLPLCLLPSLSMLRYTSLFGVAALIYSAAFLVVRAAAAPPLGAAAAATAAARSPLALAMTAKVFVLVSLLSTAFTAHYNAPRFYAELAPAPTVAGQCGGFYVGGVAAADGDGDGEGAEANDADAPVADAADAADTATAAAVPPPPSKVRRMGLVTTLGFGIAAAVAAALMGGGFWAFGDRCDGFILNNFPTSDRLAQLARLAVGSSVVCTYPFVFFGLRDGALALAGAERASGATRLATTLGLLSVVVALALVLTDLGLVVAVSGALLSSAILYVVPPAMFSRVLGARIRAARAAGLRATRRDRAERALAWFTVALGFFFAGIGTWTSLT